MKREVYKNEKNEIQRQFAQHHLEKDMADDYQASLGVDPVEHARKLRGENRGLILFLAVLLGGFGLLLWLS